MQMVHMVQRVVQIGVNGAHGAKGQMVVKIVQISANGAHLCKLVQVVEIGANW